MKDAFWSDVSRHGGASLKIFSLQISFGATSDKFSNNLLYPSFFRTVPSDKWQVEVMVVLLERFEWNWVAIVGSDEEYGQQGVQEFSKIAANRSVCVAYQGLIPVYSDPKPMVKIIVDNILTTKVEVIVVFSLPEPAEALFTEVSKDFSLRGNFSRPPHSSVGCVHEVNHSNFQVIRRNVTAVWIGSTSWAIHSRLTSLPNIQSVGTIIGFTDKMQILGLLTPYVEALLAKMSEENVHKSTLASESSTFLNPCPQCWNLSPANITLVTKPVLQRTAFAVYAAIYSVAQALHNFLGCNSTSCDYGPGTKIYPWKVIFSQF